MQVVSNVSKQTELVHFQTKMVQNKTTFIQVALKSLYFNVLYYSDICLVHHGMNLQHRRVAEVFGGMFVLTGIFIKGGF